VSKINDICQEILKDVDDSLGCAVVDIESGLLYGVAHSVPYFTQSYLDAVAAAAVEMFRGKTTRKVEDLIANSRGTDSIRLIQEVQMTTEKTFHFMKIVKDKPNALMVLITGKGANLGTGWSAVRSAMDKVSPLCP
jgi:hypothetical protein